MFETINPLIASGTQAPTGPKEPDLYSCYLRYMHEAQQVLLRLMANDSCQQSFREMHRVLSREQFEANLAAAPDGPERRARLERLFKQGAAAPPTPEEQALWRQRLAPARCGSSPS